MPNIEWERGSVDRHGKNVYGTARISVDPLFSVKMDRNLESAAVILDPAQRKVVETAIRGVCDIREYGLLAINVRTNHVHTVVSAAASPKLVMSAFKANATRELREAKLIEADRSVWSRGGSTRYLWKPRNVEAAIDYTINGQGGDLPVF